MPWSGSSPNQTFSRTDGTRTGSTTWAQADAADIGILSADHDTHDQDLAAAISATLKKDGGNKATANINWGGFKIVSLGTPTADTDAATKAYADGKAAGAATSAKTAGYTVTASNDRVLFLCDTTGGAFTLALPAAASAGNGFEIAVKKTDSSANAITIDADGSETIDGAGTVAVSSRYDIAAIRCDGSGWHVVAGTSALQATLASLAGLSLVQGDILYATAADTLVKLAKGTAAQALVMNEGATAPEWVDPSSGVFSESFESAEQTITLGGALTIAHGLASVPTMINTFLVCKTAEHGYSIGDEISFAPDEIRRWISIIPDSTNLVCRYGNIIANIIRATDGASVSEQPHLSGPC